MAPEHDREDLRRKTQTQSGHLDRLPRVVNNDRMEHGAPLPDDQELVLYPDASEDIPAEALDDIQPEELTLTISSDHLLRLQHILDIARRDETEQFCRMLARKCLQYQIPLHGLLLTSEQP